MSKWLDKILNNFKKIENFSELLKKFLFNILVIIELAGLIFVLLFAYINPNIWEILPWYGWIIPIAVVVILSIYHLFIKKKKVGKDNSVNLIPNYLIRKEKYNFQNVCWEICIDFSRFYGLTDGISITAPPRCPNCMIDLEEWKPNIGKFLWLCPECKFQVKSKFSMDETAIKLKKIVIGKIRLKNQ